MLYAEELEAIAQHREGKVRILAVTDVRRLMHRGYRMVEPPGELGRAVSHRRPIDPPAESCSDCRLKGTGCSAGSVTARDVVPRRVGRGRG